MKIVVCAKQVPDTTEVKLDPKTNTLIRDGVPSIINPDDKAGIEAALQLKEKCPGSTVTVVSMGPPQADVALREALAMGCDDALLISDRAFGGADTWATSSTIAAALKKLDYDVIISGNRWRYSTGWTADRRTPWNPSGKLCREDGCRRGRYFSCPETV